MAGHIRKRGKNSWGVVVDLGRNSETGTRDRLWRSVKGTRKDAERLLVELLHERDAGVLGVSTGRLKVGKFLQDWLKTYAANSTRPRTYQSYETIVSRHLVPKLGGVHLHNLRASHLQSLYADKLDEGLSPTTVRHIHSVIHRALRHATQWGLVARNVAELVTPPSRAHHEIQPLSPEQTRDLLAATEGDQLAALYVLAVTTGMRQGELLGLRWGDLDLDAGMARVRGSLQRTGEGLTIVQPKTASSRRQVALTAVAISSLRAHRAHQAEQRLQAGPAWTDEGLVFATEIGTPLDARNVVQRSFHPLLKKAGLPRIRFHDLRHTAATLLLAQGVHPKVAAEMLGHAHVSTTLDLYSHVTPTMQEQATQAMDALLSS